MSVSTPASDRAEQSASASTLLRLKRVALLSASTLAAINVWTGAPLLALWAGSQVTRDTRLSMAAVFVVIVVLAVSCLLLTAALTWMSARYDELTGRPAPARRTSPWLRSLRGEREESTMKRHGISAVERIVIVAVVSCVLVFEVWFFFFTGSPLPNS